MNFKRGPLFAVVLAAAVLNVAGGIYAYLTSEPMHGFVHGALAVGFGLWARHLYLGRRAAPAQKLEQPDRVELLQADLSDLERELRETQARLEFADQLLKNKPPSSER